ncbi:MAG: methyltransferase [Chloroflexi bacterium]|nr:methyltransferase [Chloroflexota bacterium]
MPDLSNSRDDVLALLHGERRERVPCFSGLISVTSDGLRELGYAFSEVHHDPIKLAAAAASTPRLSGLESAVLPLDLCVEAEVLGANVDFRSSAPGAEYPIVNRPVAASSADLRLNVPADLSQAGRLPIVLQALRELKDQIGQTVAIGAVVPGPFTLLTWIMPPGSVYTELMHPPANLVAVLDELTELLIEVAALHRAAGADFITVHEMGGSPGVIGPKRFEKWVLSPLQRLFARLAAPHVLSACGRTTGSIGLLAQAGANALSVDQLNDVAQSRVTLGVEPLLFGNIDPVKVRAGGDEAMIRWAVIDAIGAGVDAVWPGCDLSPLTPIEHVHALVNAAR